MTDRSVITKKRRPEARPAEILDAALDLFTERGFAATRLEDVASRAGLSKAAIYLYFKDKNAVLQALVQATVGANIALAEGLIAGHQGPVEPVLRQILALLGTRMSETRLPYLIKLILSESRAFPELGRWYLENVIGRALPMFRTLIDKGVATGEFRSIDPELAAKSFIAPMLLAALWKSVFEPIGAPAMDANALATTHADIFLKGLKP